MRRHTFLNTREPKESWERVLCTLKEENFNLVKTARRLSVSRTALYNWINASPDIAELLDAERKRHFEQP